MMTALIVDDEPLARAHLRRLLEAQEVEVVGEAQSAPEALRLVEEIHPELLFLDIQMPGLSGMQMASALVHMERAPLIVFVTGFSDHAVAAFENEAMDYLVKPVSPERLARTLLRARARMADTRARAEATEKVDRQVSTEGEPLRRIPVRADYSVRLVRVEDVIVAESRERHVYVRTSEGQHRTYYTLSQLETLLPADRFVRVHDSFIVNLDMAEELVFLGNHEYRLRLSNNERIPVGRTRYAQLQRHLGLSRVAAKR